MDIARLGPAQYIRQPWKNGGGTTTELIADAVDGRVVWRLSIATVAQSGPFSDFRGFDRTIMLLRGNGMVLSFAHAPDHPAGQRADKRLDRLRVPFTFPGEWKTQCRLIDGPVEDFNLMVDRRRARGQLTVLELMDEALSHALLAECEVLHCLQGCVEITVDGRRIVLETGATLRLDRCAGESVSLAARALPCSVVAVQVKHIYDTSQADRRAD